MDEFIIPSRSSQWSCESSPSSPSSRGGRRLRFVSMEGADHQGSNISRRAFIRSAGLLAFVGAGVSILAACGDSGSDRSQASATADVRAATLYRQVGCSCCATYADYLRENGFAVDMNTVENLEPIRERYGIPQAAVGCHTSVVDGYVVEGHVPVEAIDRLLSERPAVDGISVVGMPVNSPGMGEPNGQPLDVLSFRGGRVGDYMSVSTF